MCINFAPHTAVGYSELRGNVFLVRPEMNRAMRLSAHHAQIALLLIAVVVAGTMIWLAAFPPRHATEVIGTLANCQLGLIIIWATLGRAPWYLRWICMGAALSLVSLPLARGEILEDLWRDAVAGEIMPHCLASVTLLCLLREVGMCITSGAVTEGAMRRNFTLRRMFAWLTGVAVLVWAWKLLIGLMRGVWWFHMFSTWPMVLILVYSGVNSAVLDLLALATTLGASTPGTSFKRLSLLIAIVPGQMVIVQFAQGFFGGREPWSDALLRIARDDALYLAPLLGVFLLARVAGYRVTRPCGRASLPAD